MGAYSQRFSRGAFVARTSSFAALHSVGNLLPLAPLVAALQNDSRLSQTVVADKGFASVRRVGNGLYATISDPPKGLQTMCNCGSGLPDVTQVPVKAALDTHYHFDHSSGNSLYSANNVPVWAHAAVARRIMDTYGPMQGGEKSAVLAPLESRVKDARAISKSSTRKATSGCSTTFIPL
jgi:hypothetical protein